MTTEPRQFVELADGHALVRFQVAVYSLAAVMAAAHRVTDRCFVHVEKDGADWIACRLVSKHSDIDLAALGGDFSNEVLDQQLRARLAEETEGVRRLLLAQAFSRTNILQPELDTVDPAADPQAIGRPDVGTGA